MRFPVLNDIERINFLNRFTSVKCLNRAMLWNAWDISTALFPVLVYSDETKWRLQ